MDDKETTTPHIEELPSFLQMKDDLTFPQKELLSINISTWDNEKMLQIGAALPSQAQERYKSRLIEHFEMFSWSYRDMSRLDSFFVMHNLPLKLGAKPIKYKPRKMHPSKALLVKEEIEKYLQAGFIEPIDYFEWM